MDKNKKIAIKVSRIVDAKFSIQQIDDIIADIQEHIKQKQDEIKLWQDRKQELIKAQPN